MNCAVILARGGSKGCQNKNKRPLNGVPLVVRAVRTAKASGVFSQVIVATDDQDIQNLCITEKISVVDRQPVSDSQTSEAGLMELWPVWSKYEYMALIQCTSPFMFPSDISNSYRKMIANFADSACVVSPFHGVIWRAEPTGARLPRQERPKEWREAGSVYWMRVKAFEMQRSRFCGKTVMQAIPELRSMEIDTEIDFQVAEHMMKMEGLDNGLYW